jgi:hypothetical protein
MIYILLIIVNFFILSFWLWLFDNIFDLYKYKKRIIVITLIMWLISGLWIIFYPKMLLYFMVSWRDFTNTSTDNIPNESIFYFWWYLTFLLFIVKIILNWFKLNKKILINLMSFSFIFILWLFIWKLYLSVWLLYYLFVAFWEEFIKYFLGINFYEKFKFMKSDIIVFIIMSALWFAFIENIVYMLWAISLTNTLWLNFMWGMTILIVRWVVGFLVHNIFTWTIWILSMKYFKHNKAFWFALLWIMAGVMMHYLYNVLIHANKTWVIILFIIIWYFWVNYLFYRSDRLYIKDWLKEIETNALKN